MILHRITAWNIKKCTRSSYAPPSLKDFSNLIQHSAKMEISTENTYWVYILRCENDSYYTGYTNNLIKRMAEHVNGTSRCKYTRSFKPTHLVQCWQVQESKSLAMKLEKYIKSHTKDEKRWLIANPTHLTQDTRVSVFLDKSMFDTA